MREGRRSRATGRKEFGQGDARDLQHFMVEVLHVVPNALLAPVKTAKIHSIESKSMLIRFVNSN